MARGDREWLVMAEEFESDEDFRRAVTEELAGLENMGYRLGGGFVATPLRRPVAHGEVTVYETIGWHFKQVFMPAARSAEPESAADEEPAAEPAAE